MTAKQIAGYLKAAREPFGISFNDGYNVPTYGITSAQYHAIDRAMHDAYGMFPKRTPAGVREALRKFPIKATASTTRHATKKKAPAQYHVWGSGPLKGETTFYRGTDRRAAEAAFDERAYRNYEGMGDDDENVVIERGGRELRRFGPEIHQPTYFGSPRAKTARRHATKKKSPAQLEREIAEALSKSGKGHRPSKLGGDYFTVVLTRAKPESTNEWNRLPAGWDSQVRGTFPSKYAAYKWTREKLLPGAPFTIRYVPLGQ